MPLVEVWTWLCNYFECEYDPKHKAQLWKKLFTLIFSENDYSKFNISHIGLCSMCHWPNCELVTQLNFPSKPIFVI
jgi:hypothetical protein